MQGTCCSGTLWRSTGIDASPVVDPLPPLPAPVLIAPHRAGAVSPATPPDRLLRNGISEIQQRPGSILCLFNAWRDQNNRASSLFLPHFLQRKGFSLGGFRRLGLIAVSASQVLFPGRHRSSAFRHRLKFGVAGGCSLTCKCAVRLRQTAKGSVTVSTFSLFVLPYIPLLWPKAPSCGP